MLKVFVSFSDADRTLVDGMSRAAQRLGGIELYRFDHDPRPGAELSEKVKDAIRNADLFLVLLTHRSRRSTWVQQEIGIAAGAGKAIVPVVQSGVEVKGVLEGREYIQMDATDPTDGLVRAVRHLERVARKREAEAAAKREAERQRNTAIAFLAITFLIIAGSKD